MSCLLRQLSVDKSTELNENVGELINLTSWGRLNAFLPQILFYRSDQMYIEKIFYGSEVCDHARDLKYTEYSSTCYEVFIVEIFYL